MDKKVISSLILVQSSLKNRNIQQQGQTTHPDSGHTSSNTSMTICMRSQNGKNKENLKKMKNEINKTNK